MKNDINLLYRHDIKKESKSKYAVIILAVLVIIAAMYAGLALTSGEIAALKARAAELDSRLGSGASVQQQLADKTQQSRLLKLKVEEIMAIGDSKSAVKKYLAAVESSLPDSANITNLVFSEQTMNITGTAADDDVIATFCLKLRQTDMFGEVFIASSLVTDDGSAAFNITAVLPANLTTSNIIEAIEQRENPSPSPEVANK